MSGQVLRTGLDVGVMSGFPTGMPTTAARMAEIVKLGGAWTAGYLCDDASASVAAAFGTPASFTATGTPTYGNVGPFDGSDKAVGFGAANAGFAGTDVQDVGAGDDLWIAWVGKWTGTPPNNSTMISKVAAAFGSGWALTCQTGTLGLFGTVSLASISTNYLVGEWHAGMAVMERATSKMRIAIRSLNSPTMTISAETATQASYSSTATLNMGPSAWTGTACWPFLCAGWYIARGAGVATGVSANLATALNNFATEIRR